MSSNDHIPVAQQYVTDFMQRHRMIDQPLMDEMMAGCASHVTERCGVSGATALLAAAKAYAELDARRIPAHIDVEHSDAHMVVVKGRRSGQSYMVTLAALYEVLESEQRLLPEDQLPSAAADASPPGD